MDLDKLLGGDKSKQKIQSREEYNKKILELIQDYIESHPQMRFGQALYNLRLHGDLFYEEPIDTYQRIITLMES